MNKLINQSLTLAKELTSNADAIADRLVRLYNVPNEAAKDISAVAKHHQLMKHIRQLRTKINEPVPKTELPSRYPVASEEDQLGGWTLNQDFIKTVAEETQKKNSMPLHFVPLSIVEDVLLAAEKTYPLAQAAEMPLILANIEFDNLQLIENVMRNMHRPPKGYAQIQRWALVRDTFAVGSTVACALCHYFDLNPDDVIR